MNIFEIALKLTEQLTWENHNALSKEEVFDAYKYFLEQLLKERNKNE